MLNGNMDENDEDAEVIALEKRENKEREHKEKARIEKIKPRKMVMTKVPVRSQPVQPNNAVIMFNPCSCDGKHRIINKRMRF